MSLSQPLRTALLAAILIIAGLAIRSHFETELPAPPPTESEEAAWPSIRVARETRPTIVESNENWLDMNPRHSPDESTPSLGGHSLPDLPPSGRPWEDRGRLRR